MRTSPIPRKESGSPRRVVPSYAVTVNACPVAGAAPGKDGVMVAEPAEIGTTTPWWTTATAGLEDTQSARRVTSTPS
jgi:hypothetical protein